MKALVLENIHPAAVAVLEARGYQVEARPGALSEGDLVESVADVELLGIRSNTTVTPRVMDAARNLQRPRTGASECSTRRTRTLAAWWSS